MREMCDLVMCNKHFLRFIEIKIALIAMLRRAPFRVGVEIGRPLVGVYGLVYLRSNSVWSI